ncbi:retrovirus-related pol polyprotein from transposon TNT 1-94 [Tanacetum coccineum]
MLYDGNVIGKETNVILIADSEETLKLEEESRSKMLLKQSDPIVLKQKEKVFIITTLNNYLRKFKGKDIVDNAAQVSNNTTIASGLYKLDLITLAPKNKNNRETHIYYLKHTMEQAAILREIVEQAYSLNPLDSASYSTCKYVKLIQELPGYVRDTCPVIHKPSKKLLVEAARTMLIFAQAPLFLWAEAIATACYTQNRSIIRRRHGKTPYELLHDRKPDLSYLHVFGALCYPNNDSENLGKLQAKADIGIFIGYAPKKKAYRIYNRRTQKIIETIHVDFDELTAMASEQLGSGPGLQCMTPATSSSGLVPNPIPQQPCIPPPRDDWDRLFQPMFDEYFNPPTIVVSPVPVADAPRAVDLADSPVSMSIDQDAPSTSIPSTQDQEHSLIISQGFEESPKTPHFHDDPLHESLHEDSTSQGSSSNVRPIHTPFESLGRWTKDHPIANVIGDPSCSVSTRKQLQTDAMWCYFDAFLTSVEPKNFKQAMTEPSWIDAMQEEIHEFKRLQVWELVLCLD